MSRFDVVICAPVRTAIGTYGGALKGMPAPDIGSIVIRETIKRAGLKGSDVNVAVMGQVIQAGAIAHGHPIGATGAILVTRLLHALRRDQLQRRMVTLCIGGGQGIALTFEVMK